MQRESELFYIYSVFFLYNFERLQDMTLTCVREICACFTFMNIEKFMIQKRFCNNYSLLHGDYKSEIKKRKLKISCEIQ